MTPIISVVIPTYNRSSTVARAITSVLRQNLDSWEIIVVDDGSTDNTKDVVSHLSVDARIHYYFTPHKGVSAARNLGIQKSKGKYVALLDSDDEFCDQTLLAHLNTHSEYSVSFTLAQRIIQIDKGKRITSNTSERMITEQDLITGKIGLSASLMFFDRKIGTLFPFDESMPAANDLDFILRAMNQYKVRLAKDSFVIVHRSLAYRRISTDFSAKLTSLDKLKQKIIRGIYSLKQSDKVYLYNKITYLEGLFSFLIKDNHQSRIFLWDFFHLDQSLSVKKLIGIALYVVSFSEFLSKLTISIMNRLWLKGMTLQ